MGNAFMDMTMQLWFEFHKVFCFKVPVPGMCCTFSYKNMC
jgi:hypothetical protein